MNMKSETPIIDAVTALARREAAGIQNGKGSKPRPTNRQKFNNNYDRIFRKKK